MADYTAQCSVDIGKELLDTIKIDGMRNVWCRSCVRTDCDYSNRNSTWESRMKRQKEVLIDHPQFADPTSSRYDSFQKNLWPTLFQPTPITLNDGSGWATVDRGTQADQGAVSESQTPATVVDPNRYPDLPARLNTPYPNEGRMADGSPAKGMTTQVVDTWAPQNKIEPGAVFRLK